MRRDLFIRWSCEAEDEVLEVSLHTHEYVTFSWSNSLQITCKDPMENHSKLDLGFCGFSHDISVACWVNFQLRLDGSNMILSRLFSIRIMD
ncbi:hypothetical protein GIB67_021121 [Kingdonia uniflora]|uniref:Uncharacterized protein n=1 Tax=Kingdonia uniflora TaxID=39325 RepID=A0A7J7N7D9_9MAGN|nr:hypothetical protein GIB67_021121 [Kingdonia uniflora]